MSLTSQWFRGYASEVEAEIRAFASGKKGSIVNVQIVKRDTNISGIWTEAVVWYWA